MLNLEGDELALKVCCSQYTPITTTGEWENRQCSCFPVRICWWLMPPSGRGAAESNPLLSCMLRN